jgi:hypothetical protein
MAGSGPHAHGDGLRQVTRTDSICLVASTRESQTGLVDRLRQQLANPSSASQRQHSVTLLRRWSSSSIPLTTLPAAPSSGQTGLSAVRCGSAVSDRPTLQAMVRVLRGPCNEQGRDSSVVDRSYCRYCGARAAPALPPACGDGARSSSLGFSCISVLYVLTCMKGGQSGQRL